MLGLVILTKKYGGLFLGPGKSKEAKVFIQKEYVDKWVGNMH